MIKVQFKNMKKAAVRKACEALAFAYPYGVDVATRSALAHSVDDDASHGERNEMLLTSHALGHLDPKAPPDEKPQ